MIVSPNIVEEDVKGLEEERRKSEVQKQVRSGTTFGCDSPCDSHPKFHVDSRNLLKRRIGEYG